MMGPTIIKASCSECREEVNLEPKDVALVVCSKPELSRYGFHCPECNSPSIKPADDHIVCLLVQGGVVAEVLTIPEEALEEKTGAVIDYDDLLDFQLALMDNDLLAELAS